MSMLKHASALVSGGLCAALVCTTVYSADKASTTPAKPSGPIVPEYNYTYIDGKRQQMRWDDKLSKQVLGGTYASSKAWFKKARKDKLSQTQFWDEMMTRLAPHWYGTPWRYHGVSQTPGEGAIACGYFLTTVMRDAGLKLPRVKLAQVASETMIRRLVHKKHIRHFLRMDHATFVSKMKRWGKGLYIIGMDNHTGFLWHDGKELYFIHSSWWPRKRTMKEIALHSAGLASTKYRVVGKLSDDKALYQAWLKGKRVGYKNASR